MQNSGLDLKPQPPPRKGIKSENFAEQESKSTRAEPRGGWGLDAEKRFCSGRFEEKNTKLKAGRALSHPDPPAWARAIPDKSNFKQGD